MLWEQRHHRVAARGKLHILELCVQEQRQLSAIPNPHPRGTPSTTYKPRRDLQSLWKMSHRLPNWLGSWKAATSVCPLPTLAAFPKALALQKPKPER